MKKVQSLYGLHCTADDSMFLVVGAPSHVNLQRAEAWFDSQSAGAVE